MILIHPAVDFRAKDTSLNSEKKTDFEFGPRRPNTIIAKNSGKTKLLKIRRNMDIETPTNLLKSI